jgi:hypothetical protein
MFTICSKVSKSGVNKLHGTNCESELTELIVDAYRYRPIIVCIS